MATIEERPAEIVVSGHGTDRRWRVLTPDSERTFTSLRNARAGLARVQRGEPLGTTGQRGRVSGSQNKATARPLSREARQLNQYAAQNGLSVQRLAELFGISFYTMRNWMHGRTTMSGLALYRLGCLLKGGHNAL